MERPGTSERLLEERPDEWPAEEGKGGLQGQLASEDEEEFPPPPDSQMHRAERRR